MDLFRFVNSVKASSLDKELIWSHVKTIRFEYLKKIINLECDNNILTPNVIKNFEIFLQIIGSENSHQMSRNLTKSSMNYLIEMFLALSSCPSFQEKLYLKAIYGNGTISRIAMLTSNIMRKAKDDFKMKATKIFAKISSVLGFKYISYHHEGNQSFDDMIQLTKNISDVKGELGTLLKGCRCSQTKAILFKILLNSVELLLHSNSGYALKS